MKKLMLIVALSLLTNAKAQVNVDSFKTFIAPLQLQFDMPKQYKSVKILENRDLYYNFAMQKKKQIQVRYTVTDLGPWMEEYEESLKDTNTTMLHPNKLHKSAIIANCMNLTGGALPEIAYFDKDAVKREFGADSGGSAFFQFDSEYGTGWKYGQIVFIHLDNVADVYIVFMTNDIEKHVDLMLESFYALRFVE